MILKELLEKPRKADDEDSKKFLFVYGAPMVGKTTFASTFPKPLTITTDGNTQNIKGDVIDLRKESAIEVANGIKKTVVKLEKAAYIINDLLTNQHDFETIVFDTIDNLYQWNESRMKEKLFGSEEAELPKNDYGKTASLIKRKFISFYKMIVELKLKYNVIILGHEFKGSDFNTGEAIDEPFLKSLFTSKSANFKEITSQLDGYFALKTKNVKIKDIQQLQRILIVNINVEGTTGNRYGLVEPIINPTFERLQESIKQIKK